MKRTIFLGSVLLVCVAASWIVAVYFHDRLPESVPLDYGEQPYATAGPKELYFVFPGVITAAALAVLALYPLRDRLPFPGRKRALKLPGQYRETILQRLYQLAIMTGLFVFLLFGFVHVSLSLYTLGVIAALQAWPLYAACAIFVLYLVFNFIRLGRLVNWAEERTSEERKA